MAGPTKARQCSQKPARWCGTATVLCTLSKDRWLRISASAPVCGEPGGSTPLGSPVLVIRGAPAAESASTHKTASCLSSIHQSRLTTVNFGKPVLQGGLRNRGHPNALCSRTAQDHRACRGTNRERLVVIALNHVELDSGPDAAGIQEFEQMAIAFVNATYAVMVPGLGLGEQYQPAPLPAFRAFHLAEIAVRAGPPAAQLGEQLGFEIGRDRMFQALSFIVHLPPLHAEKFSQHAFNQVMTQRELPGDLVSCCRQPDLALG